MRETWSSRMFQVILDISILMCLSDWWRFSTLLFIFNVFLFDRRGYNLFPPDKLSGQTYEIARLNSVTDMHSSQWINDLKKKKRNAFTILDVEALSEWTMWSIYVYIYKYLLCYALCHLYLGCYRTKVFKKCSLAAINWNFS